MIYSAHARHQFNPEQISVVIGCLRRPGVYSEILDKVEEQLLSCRPSVIGPRTNHIHLSDCFPRPESLHHHYAFSAHQDVAGWRWIASSGGGEHGSSACVELQPPEGGFIRIHHNNRKSKEYLAETEWTITFAALNPTAMLEQVKGTLVG